MKGREWQIDLGGIEPSYISEGFHKGSVASRFLKWPPMPHSYPCIIPFL